MWQLSRQKLFGFVLQNEMEQLLAGLWPRLHIGISKSTIDIPIWRCGHYSAKSCSVSFCRTKWNNFWRDCGHVSIYGYRNQQLIYLYGDVAIIPPKVVPVRFAERHGTTFGGIMAQSPYMYIEINN